MECVSRQSIDVPCLWFVMKMIKYSVLLSVVCCMNSRIKIKYFIDLTVGKGCNKLPNIYFFFFTFSSLNRCLLQWEVITEITVSAFLNVTYSIVSVDVNFFPLWCQIQ